MLFVWMRNGEKIMRRSFLLIQCRPLSGFKKEDAENPSTE